MMPKNFSYPLFLITAIAGAFFAVAGYISIFCYQMGALMPAEYWVRDITHVKEHVAEKAESRPRILIMAGSGSLFGIDSETIQAETGYPVVNFSSHAGLSFDYLAKQIQRIAKPGDIVLAPLEPVYYTRTADTNWFLHNVMTWGTWYFKGLGPMEKLDFIFSAKPSRVLGGAVVKFFEQRIPADARRKRTQPPRKVIDHAKEIWSAGSPPKGRLYSYTALNDHGDIRSNSGTSPAFRELYEGYIGGATEVSNEFVRQYLQFVHDLEQNGVRVILTWPSTMQNEHFDLSKPDGRARVAALKKNLLQHGIPIVGSAADSHFSKDHFFNSSLHLNMKGKKIRSQKLADALNCALKGLDCRDAEPFLDGNAVQPAQSNRFFVLDTLNLVFSAAAEQSGFRPKEGPYPQWGIPFPVRWMVAPEGRVSFEAQGMAGRKRYLKITARTPVLPQAIEVLANGKKILSGSFSSKNQWQAWTTSEFQLRPGKNHLTIMAANSLHSDAKNDALHVLLGEMQMQRTREDRPPAD